MSGASAQAKKQEKVITEQRERAGGSQNKEGSYSEG